MEIIVGFFMFLSGCSLYLCSDCSYERMLSSGCMACGGAMIFIGILERSGFA